MIGKSPSAESYLLYFIVDDHVEDAFRASLNVVCKNELVGKVPYLQVVSSCSKEVVLLMKYYRTNGHGLIFSASDKRKRRIGLIDSSHAVHVPHR